MKKAIFFCSLIILFGLNQVSFATDEVESPKTETTSKAHIGFSTKTEAQENDNEKKITKSRLPTTGEAAGVGISLLGLIILTIVFRKELKEIIKKKHRRKNK